MCFTPVMQVVSSCDSSASPDLKFRHEHATQPTAATACERSNIMMRRSDAVMTRSIRKVKRCDDAMR